MKTKPLKNDVSSFIILKPTFIFYLVILFLSLITNPSRANSYIDYLKYDYPFLGSIEDDKLIPNSHLYSSDEPLSENPNITSYTLTVLDTVPPKMYWPDTSTQSIVRADLDGSNVENFITTSANPVGVAVYRDSIYWTAYENGSPVIQRANLDGSGVEKIVNSLLNQPSGIDVIGNKVYWHDTFAGKLKRANLDGSDIIDLPIIGTGVFDIEIYGDKIYWTNTSEGKIQRANLDGTNINDIWTDSLSSPFALTIHNKKIYWSNGTNLMRANLDGENDEILLSTPENIGDIAISGSKIYWNNDATTKIKKANLDGSNIESVHDQSSGNTLMTINNTNLPIEYIYGCQGDSLTFCYTPDTLYPSMMYQWFDGNGNPMTALSSDSCLTIGNLDSADLGYYYCEYTDINTVVLAESPQYFVQLYLMDSLGGKYPSDQIIVEFIDGISETQKNYIQNLFAADSLGACVCGGIELWRLFPEELILDGESVSDIEEKVNKARMRTESEEVEYNYLDTVNSIFDTLQISKPFSNGIATSSIELAPRTTTFSNTVRVAVIDTGIDTLHEKFITQANFDFFNNMETLDGDLDFNCIIGDVQGFDFANDDSFAFDDNEHGTHVADIIRQAYFANDILHLPPTGSDGTLLEIINIKSHDLDGSGYLFDEICSFVYATDKRACIINYSAGRNGLPSEIMRNTLEKVNDEAGALVISSAGNKGLDNSIMPHYPSGYDMAHIIEVSADSLTTGNAYAGLTSFSNYGIEVDIAAPGYLVKAAIPGGNNNNAEVGKSGTSQSAAFVSGVAARIKALCPNLGWAEIKHYLLFIKGEEDMDPLLDGKVNNNRRLDYDNTYFDALIDASCMITSIERPKRKDNLNIMAYPNPFSSEMNILIEAPSQEDLSMKVTDLMGRQLFAQKLSVQPGLNSFIWDGLNISGGEITAGLYIITIHSKDQIWSEKIIKQ